MLTYIWLFDDVARVCVLIGSDLLRLCREDDVHVCVLIGFGLVEVMSRR